MSQETNKKKKVVRETMDLNNLEGAFYTPDLDATLSSSELREYSLRQNMTMLKETLPGKNSR